LGGEVGVIRARQKRKKKGLERRRWHDDGGARKGEFSVTFESNTENYSLSAAMGRNQKKLETETKEFRGMLRGRELYRRSFMIDLQNQRVLGSCPLVRKGR